jgi:hypothetical protein
MDRWGINESDGGGPLPFISLAFGCVAVLYVVYDAITGSKTPTFQEFAVRAFMAFGAGALLGLPISCMIK